MGGDRMRYLVLGSILLFLVLYLSREMRLASLASLTPSSLVSWMSEPTGSMSRPRHVMYSARQDVEETREAMEEKTALDSWIQSRLTQKGLKDMTEVGDWQAEQAHVL